MDEIQEDYVEKFFEGMARNVPEYYCEGVDKPIQAKENVLESAVEATEETTRTSTINEQVENIKKQSAKEKNETSKEMEM